MHHHLSLSIMKHFYGINRVVKQLRVWKLCSYVYIHCGTIKTGPLAEAPSRKTQFLQDIHTCLTGLYLNTLIIRNLFFVCMKLARVWGAPQSVCNTNIPKFCSMGCKENNGYAPIFFVIYESIILQGPRELWCCSYDNKLESHLLHSWSSPSVRMSRIE